MQADVFFLQNVDSKKLEKAESKIKQKQEKRAATDVKPVKS